MMATGTPARKTKLQGERSLWQTTSRPAAAAAGAASNAAGASWYRRGGAPGARAAGGGGRGGRQQCRRRVVVPAGEPCGGREHGVVVCGGEVRRHIPFDPGQHVASRPVPPQGARGAVEARGLEVPEQAVDEVRAQRRRAVSPMRTTPGVIRPPVRGTSSGSGGTCFLLHRDDCEVPHHAARRPRPRLSGRRWPAVARATKPGGGRSLEPPP